VPVVTAHKRGDFDAERELDAAMLPVEVKEQRLSGLLQSLLCGACLGALSRAQGAGLLRGAGLPPRSVDTAIEAAASGRLTGSTGSGARAGFLRRDSGAAAGNCASALQLLKLVGWVAAGRKSWLLCHAARFVDEL
jgi:hypothetical protein